MNQNNQNQLIDLEEAVLNNTNNASLNSSANATQVAGSNSASNSNLLSGTMGLIAAAYLAFNPLPAEAKGHTNSHIKNDGSFTYDHYGKNTSEHVQTNKNSNTWKARVTIDGRSYTLKGVINDNIIEKTLSQYFSDIRDKVNFKIDRRNIKYELKTTKPEKIGDKDDYDVVGDFALTLFDRNSGRVIYVKEGSARAVKNGHFMDKADYQSSMDALIEDLSQFSTGNYTPDEKPKHGHKNLQGGVSYLENLRKHFDETGQRYT